MIPRGAKRGWDSRDSCDSLVRSPIRRTSRSGASVCTGAGQCSGQVNSYHSMEAGHRVYYPPSAFEPFQDLRLRMVPLPAGRPP